MEAITSTAVTFCPDCGSILDLPATSKIVCGCCEFMCTYADLPSLKVVTKSRVRPRQTWLSEKIDDDAKAFHRAMIEEQCPKCKNPEMEYYTMQLRSADEGQTVFYECPKCRHKFSQNT